MSRMRNSLLPLGKGRDPLSRQAVEETKDLVIRGLVNRTRAHVLYAPDPGLRGVIQHRPARKEPGFDAAMNKLLWLDVSIVPADTPVTGCHFLLRAFKQLKVQIPPHDKRARNVIPLIAPPGIEQYACQHRLVKAEGLRGVDELDEGHGHFQSSQNQLHGDELILI